MGSPLLLLGMLAGFSPDSARTKKTKAKIGAIQKVNRAGFDISIKFFFFYASAFRTVY
jgi:hypothetical protein